MILLSYIDCLGKNIHMKFQWNEFLNKSYTGRNIKRKLTETLIFTEEEEDSGMMTGSWLVVDLELNSHHWDMKS